jgi:probable phosphoglycerate mutase
MTRILLVRHGESTWNAAGRWQGQADPPLSERGRDQAVEAAARVGTIDAIVTSDLERAAHTGQIIARLVGVDHVAVDPALRERDAGPLSGLTRDEIHERFPGLLADDPAGFQPDDDGNPRWPEGWESDTDLWDRLEVALVAMALAVPDGDVLGVTHGGVIYALERRLGAIGRPRLSNLDAVQVEAFADGRITVGERMSLVDPTHTLAIEADRI